MDKFLDKYDSKIQRLLEILPGLMTWSLLLSPIWLGLIYPQIVIFILTFLAVYWVYLAVKHFTGLYIGYKRYSRELKVDWLDEVNKLKWEELPHKETLPDTLQSVRHFLLIPACNEPYEVLQASIESIFEQKMPLNQILLVYTAEEKQGQRVLEDVKKILAGREDQLAGFLSYIHPAGIVGEAVGAGAANRAWGAKHAVKVITERGDDIKNYIFSTIDADHVMHSHYLSRLTHLYLTTDKRYNHFYTTAVHLFSNNYWKVPTLMRIEATSTTLGTLSNWVVALKDVRETFSAYSASLQTLVDADYWDVSLGVDDTVFFWRAFFVRNGDFTGVCHYIPYSADAVEGRTLVEAHKSLYRQLLRWGWGVMVFPLSVKGFLRNKKVPLYKKLLWVFYQIKFKVVLISTVFLITFGFFILTFANEHVKQLSFAYSLPQTTSAILTFTLFFLVPISILRFKIVGPIPSTIKGIRRLVIYFEQPLVVLNLLTFSTIPFIDAQTRMLLGKKMKDLYHTPKMRR